MIVLVDSNQSSNEMSKSQVNLGVKNLVNQGFKVNRDLYLFQFNDTVQTGVTVISSTDDGETSFE